MMEEKIEITIAADGSSTIEVSGVKGKKCLDLTQALEKAIGKVAERKKKTEFFQKEEAEDKLRLGK